MATLSQLLELPELGLSLLQAGPGDPELSWVSITELLSMNDYLEGGEIIMTTGLSLGANDPGWRDFVAGLSRARVAAIGFGIGVNHDTVPAPLLHAASTYRVALFEIPLPIPFIAVSKAVAGLLRSDELRAARSALQVQLRLLDSARGTQDPAEVLASISQATGRQLALISGPDRILASTQGFQAEGAELVALDSEGSLRLAIAGTGPLTPEGSSVIAAGAMALGFSVRSDRASDRAERERWELLTGRMLSGALPVETAEVLSPGIVLPDTVRAVAVQGSPEDISAWRREPRIGLDRLIGSTEELAGGLARAWQVVDGAEPEAAVMRIEQHGLDLVVGRPVSRRGLPVSARSAASRLRDLPGRASLYAEPRRAQVIWADRDAPFLEAVLSLGSSPEHGAIALSRQVLGPLAATGPAGQASTEPDREVLCETLHALFVSDGQRGPAASALGIHRNTLRDRVTRIERLTGRSLASAEDRAELWFALRTEELA
ncbi:PucR family transcriptional regulator [Leucobacter sp. G161]|uniref:PucR family transcriptional regulator n=1 Tax=Leucobacter sp. G161 TaxID=663704 RepID=UPI00073D06B1|nr:PucR family transcriptional regulator [Leucobacter sp. G161]KUF06171.1 Fis family transcriptional regulator [Leucobacter sp. G161]